MEVGKSVSAVRAKTAGAPEPSYTPVRTGVSLPTFSAVTVADTWQLPDKSSAADQLMKQVPGELGPFMCELFNRSMSAGHLFLSCVAANRASRVYFSS